MLGQEIRGFRGGSPSFHLRLQVSVSQYHAKITYLYNFGYSRNSASSPGEGGCRQLTVFLDSICLVRPR